MAIYLLCSKQPRTGNGTVRPQRAHTEHADYFVIDESRPCQLGQPQRQPHRSVNIQPQCFHLLYISLPDVV